MMCNANQRRRLQRGGATLVELAVTMPLMFLLCFSAFEFCRVATIRHTVNSAVYEACRAGQLPGATAQEVENAGRRVLGTLELVKARVHVDPEVILPETREVTVRIEVPLDENSLVPNRVVNGRDVVCELTMPREFN